MIDLSAGRYTISARFGAAFEADNVGGDMLGLGISLTRANLSVSVRTLDFTGGVMPAGVTFTRAGGGGRINSSGLYEWVGADVPRFDYDPVPSATNLLLGSEEFDNAVWGKVAGSVTANATTAPTGAATADLFTENTSTGQHDVRVTSSFVSGTTYTFSVFAKSNGRQLFMLFPIGGAGHGASFDLVGGTVTSVSASVTAEIVPVGGGWFRCSVTATASSTTAAPVRFLTYNGTSSIFTGDGVSGFYLFGAQLEVGAFATSYIPTTATATRSVYQPRGLLMEESRTNYFTHSGDAASAWTIKSNTTVLSDVETAPDGTVTADAIVENTSMGGHYVERTITVAANQFITYEIFVKPKGSYREIWLHLYANGFLDSIRAQFNTMTGTVVGTAVGGAGSGITASITPISNGWHRLRLTGQVTTAAVTDLKPRIAFVNSSANYTGDGVSGYYFWGGDVQVGAFPTSHIHTTASPATRAADQPRINANLGTRDLRVTTEAGVQVLTAQALTGSYWPALTGPQRIRKIEVL